MPLIEEKKIEEEESPKQIVEEEEEYKRDKVKEYIVHNEGTTLFMEM